MRILLHDIKLVYQAILDSAVMQDGNGCTIYIFASNDCDSIASLKILTVSQITQFSFNHKFSHLDIVEIWWSPIYCYSSVFQPAHYWWDRQTCWLEVFEEFGFLKLRWSDRHARVMVLWEKWDHDIFDGLPPTLPSL